MLNNSMSYIKYTVNKKLVDSETLSRLFTQKPNTKDCKTFFCVLKFSDNQRNPQKSKPQKKLYFLKKNYS